jgi:hypothetical protein
VEKCSGGGGSSATTSSTRSGSENGVDLNLEVAAVVRRRKMKGSRQ